MLSYQVITHQEALYKVLRAFTDYPDFPVSEIKQNLAVCNMVLRRDGKLYFCRKIEDAVILEDSTNEQIQLVEKGSQESAEVKSDQGVEGQVPPAAAD